MTGFNQVWKTVATGRLLMRGPGIVSNPLIRWMIDVQGTVAALRIRVPVIRSDSAFAGSSIRHGRAGSSAIVAKGIAN